MPQKATGGARRHRRWRRRHCWQLESAPGGRDLESRQTNGLPAGAEGLASERSSQLTTTAGARALGRCKRLLLHARAS